MRFAQFFFHFLTWPALAVNAVFMLFHGKAVIKTFFVLLFAAFRSLFMCCFFAVDARELTATHSQPQLIEIFAPLPVLLFFLAILTLTNINLFAC